MVIDSEKLSENSGKNTSVLVVSDFGLSVDSGQYTEFDSSVSSNLDFLANLNIFSCVDCELFSALKSK